MPEDATLPLNAATAKPVFVTGTAGFIGFHLTLRLNALGVNVVGFDNVNDYYEVSLKEARLATLFAGGSEAAAASPAAAAISTSPITLPDGTVSPAAVLETSAANPNFSFVRGSLEDLPLLNALFARFAFETVIHLAAQAGVRYSLTNPLSYIQSNLLGFEHILECCRHHNVQHLTYASSSSVYGGNVKTPFCESDSVDHPVSLYAATKKSNELMAHAYAHLFNMPCTGLRFFTVYGPYGRPDMAPAIFTRAILEDKPIDLFNFGKMRRDFTFVTDIVEGILRVAERPPAKNPNWDAMHADPATSSAPYRVFNIGNSDPVELLEFVSTLEACIGQEAKKNFKEMQPGDVLVTSADVSFLERVTGFSPSTPLRVGLQRYVDWFRCYYKFPVAATEA
jgi:UDP-glucuronate 4-epimerase